jgi:hypothetical protein
MPNRSIIIHFHFFKNAGTSVETIFRKQFGKRFMCCEPGGATETHPADALVPILEKNEAVQAISSHTIRFPLPVKPGWKFFPIVFVRHPLDRILSMYNFERRQTVQSPGAILAKQHGAAGYVMARLESPGENTLRNYQASMLAGCTGDNDTLLQAASTALQDLPVVGVVDEFSKSIGQFSTWLVPHFPGLFIKPIHRERGVLRGMSLEERIMHLRKIVGDETFTRLEEENSVDLALYLQAREKLEAGRSQDRN